MATEDYKKELRKEKTAAREALPEEDRVRLSAEICRRIIKTPEYKYAGVIFAYKWIKGEVRLDELEQAARRDGKRIVYPLCISRTEMVAVEPGTDDAAWKDSGSFGIMEPDPDKGTIVDPEDIGLVVAPCSAFDDKCRRLGMGGGFYDRYLPLCTKAGVIAAAYEVQRAEAIPTDEYDIPVDAVVTEARVIYR